MIRARAMQDISHHGTGAGGMRAHEYALAVIRRLAAALKTLVDAGALHIEVRLRRLRHPSHHEQTTGANVTRELFCGDARDA